MQIPHSQYANSTERDGTESNKNAFSDGIISKFLIVFGVCDVQNPNIQDKKFLNPIFQTHFHKMAFFSFDSVRLYAFDLIPFIHFYFGVLFFSFRWFFVRLYDNDGHFIDNTLLIKNIPYTRFKICRNCYFHQIACHFEREKNCL